LTAGARNSAKPKQSKSAGKERKDNVPRVLFRVANLHRSRI